MSGSMHQSWAFRSTKGTATRRNSPETQHQLPFRRDLDLTHLIGVVDGKNSHYQWQTPGSSVATASQALFIRRFLHGK
jgi:hypothetical protein